MENDKIHDYTDAYLESYLRALDKTHNPDLAIQTAMGVTRWWSRRIYRRLLLQQRRRNAGALWR